MSGEDATRPRGRSKIRSSLRALTAQMPLPKDRLDHLISLSTQPDRAAVIAATAYLEDGLKGSIAHLLIQTLPDIERERLFDQYQGCALATFDARIQIAYAMGILGPKSKNDLDTLKRIRNVFAHSILEISLDNVDIAGAISTLHILSSTQQVSIKLLFLYAVMSYYTRLVYFPGVSVEGDIREIAKGLMKPSP